MSYDASKYAFVDIETTGLNPKKHKVWEIAVITEKGEFQAFVPAADGGDWEIEALRMNRMLERYDPKTPPHFDPLPPPAPHRGVSGLFADLGASWWDGIDRMRGRHLVGANPDFDRSFLARLVKSTPWHHRTICVEAMAMAHVKRYVKGLKGAAEAVGVPYDADQHHGALYDAKLAKAIFEKIMGEPE